MVEAKRTFRWVQWGSTVLAGVIATVLCMSLAVAGEKPVAVATGDEAVHRVSPHVLAAKRRAEQGEAPMKRFGLQSRMHKDAARRHLPAARRGT